MEDLKEDILLFLGIAVVIIISTLIGYILGRCLPLEEKYKTYYENNITIVERI